MNDISKALIWAGIVMFIIGVVYVVSDYPSRMKIINYDNCTATTHATDEECKERYLE